MSPIARATAKPETRTFISLSSSRTAGPISLGGTLSAEEQLWLAGLADEALDARLVDRALQALCKADLRLPAEELLGAGDVRLADLRIVDRQRLEDDLGAG